MPGGVVVEDLISNDVAVVNGAVLNWISNGEKGGPVLVPFLRLAGRGIGIGYNSGKKLNVQLQNVPVVPVDGGMFYEFVLSAKGRDLAVDTIEIFTSPEGMLKTSNLGELGVKRWDLDRPCWDYSSEGCSAEWDDVVVRLNADRHVNGEKGYLRLLVPVERFAGAMDTDFVYFFCVMGSPGKAFGGEPSAAAAAKGKVAARWGVLVSAVTRQ